MIKETMTAEAMPSIIIANTIKGMLKFLPQKCKSSKVEINPVLIRLTYIIKPMRIMPIAIIDVETPIKRLLM
jgi:hypothetical protein